MVRPVIGVLALSLALAACGGEPKADPSPTPSAPVTTPVSTTPAPPVMPEEAKANTKAGAIAFVRYYIALVNHAQATGDLAGLAGVEEPPCKSCTDGRSYLSKIYDAGGHVAGGRWTARDMRARRSGSNWAVTVRGDFAPSDVYAPATSQPDHADGGPTLTNFIVWHSREWKVRSWFSG
jgi:hypothetical protein